MPSELVQEFQLPAQRRRSSLPQAGWSVGEEITLTEEEQHDLLDALAAKIEERMDALLLSDGNPFPTLVLES